MTVRPILFSGPMVRALLDGRKTQTRRVMKPQPTNIADCDRVEWQTKSGWCEASEDQFPRLVMEDLAHLLPYAVGDLLWVREEFSGENWLRDTKPSERLLKVNPHQIASLIPETWYWADGSPSSGDWEKPRPSIFLPRWASRLTLRVTEVRVKRLQEIEYDDAISEGMKQRMTSLSPGTGTYAHDNDVVDDFRTLWDSLNAKRDGGAFSWASNPWVVAVSFEVIRANVAQVMEASDG